MEEQQLSSVTTGKSSFLRSALIFLTIIIVTGAAWLLWNAYLSPSARSTHEAKENYAKYEEWQKKYDQAMAEDTYGGKTPEETLQLFIAALEKEDIDLASKYFIFDENLSRQKWIDFLTKIKDDGNLQRFASDLKKLEKGNSIKPGEDIAYILRNNDGTVGFGLRLKLNNKTSVWKIEEM